MAITEEQDARVQRKWSAGLLVYQQGIPEEQRVPPLLTDVSFPQRFTKWFETHRPDVVVSQDHNCIEYLGRLRLRVPDDVGFAHLSLTDTDTGLAGINQNGRIVGASAIDLIDGQLRRNERGLSTTPKTVLIQGRWIPGPTVRDLSRKTSGRRVR
jgi:LacI family transcriptional regulator